MKPYRLATIGCAFLIGIDLLMVTMFLADMYLWESGSDAGLAMVAFIPITLFDILFCSIFAAGNKRYTVLVLTVSIILRCIISFGFGLIIWGLPLLFLGLSLKRSRGMPMTSDIKPAI